MRGFYGGKFFRNVSVTVGPSGSDQGWLDDLKQWDTEANHLQHKENAHMGITEFERNLKIKAENKSNLLQEIARLEGKMSGTTKVDQSQVYDILCIVRTIVENS